MSQKIESTIKMYKYLDIYIADIYNDIKNVNDIHANLYKGIFKKEHYYQYGVYIDDIYFQKLVMTKEIQQVEYLRGISIRKLYADLFRLYQRIIKKYLDLLKESDTAGSLKKYYTELNIRIFNELDIMTIYKYRDIENISQHLELYLTNIWNIYNDMKKNIDNMKEKVNVGYSMESFILAYMGEVIKLETDIKTLNDMYDLILKLNEKILIKLLKRSKVISSEVSDNQKEYEEKIKNVKMGISPELSVSSSPSQSPSKIIQPVIVDTISILSSSTSSTNSDHDDDNLFIRGIMIKDDDNTTIMEEMKEQIQHNQQDSSNQGLGEGDFIS
jgi:hypothetical protein